jgi:hypothetical protein
MVCLEAGVLVSIRTKLILLAGLILAAVVAALVTGENVKPMGTLSRKDVIAIRSAVTQFEGLGWKTILESNLRYWPSLVLEKLTFRIVDLREDSILGVTIHSDGTRDEHPRVIVRCKAVGRLPKTYTLERQKGGWGCSMAPTILYPDENLHRPPF